VQVKKDGCISREEKLQLSRQARAFNAKPILVIKEKGKNWILDFMGDIDR